MHNVKEVARRFNVCEKTARKWINDGKMASIRIGDVVRVTEPQVLEFISKNESVQASR
jgi:excisionase family DNA binding protein